MNRYEKDVQMIRDAMESRAAGKIDSAALSAVASAGKAIAALLNAELAAAKSVQMLEDMKPTYRRRLNSRAT